MKTYTWRHLTVTAEQWHPGDPALSARLGVSEYQTHRPGVANASDACVSGICGRRTDVNDGDFIVTLPDGSKVVYSEPIFHALFVERRVDERRSAGYPEFMVRVKLPSSSDFHCSPSGDTEFEEARGEALRKATPPGFSVCHPRSGERWPHDSEGYTWVRLRCTDETASLTYWMHEAQLAQRELARIRKAVGTGD